MTIRSETFEHLLRFLHHKSEIVTLLKPPTFARRNDTYPRFAITFDDGWKDTADLAFPLAQQYGSPFAVFICPKLMGKLAPFWPERVLNAWRQSRDCPSQRQELQALAEDIGLADVFERINVTEASLLAQFKDLSAEQRQHAVTQFAKVQTAVPAQFSHGAASPDATMSWNDVARLSGRQIAIGSHTVTHEILTTLPELQVNGEIIESKQMIERELHRECRLFAYPSGSWSPEVRRLVAGAGYTHAFGNDSGVWLSTTDPWVIPRVNIWEGSVVGPSGRFSPIVFEYAAFWLSLRGGDSQLNL